MRVAYARLPYSLQMDRRRMVDTQLDHVVGFGSGGRTKGYSAWIAIGVAVTCFEDET